MRASNLQSSLIARVVHDEEQRTLRICFRNGGAYVYFDVPGSEYEALKTAPSPGQHYNRSIRGRYRCLYDPGRRRFRPDAA